MSNIGHFSDLHIEHFTKFLVEETKNVSPAEELKKMKDSVFEQYANYGIERTFYYQEKDSYLESNTFLNLVKLKLVLDKIVNECKELKLDKLLIAGDTAQDLFMSNDFHKYIEQQSGCKVIAVAGNHEFYTYIGVDYVKDLEGCAFINEGKFGNVYATMLGFGKLEHPKAFYSNSNDTRYFP